MNTPTNQADIETRFATHVQPDDSTLATQPEWVLAKKYQDLTGVTRETVKQRKKSGVWKEGQQVAVTADGHTSGCCVAAACIRWSMQ